MYANTPETDRFLDRKLPSQVGLANPHLTAVGFDLPAVAPIFEESTAAIGVSDRVRFQPDDVFVDPLPSADGIMMRLNMLIETPGFSSTRVQPLVGPDSMVIGLR